MKKFVEVEIIFKLFDEKVILTSGVFDGEDPWADDIYDDVV